MQKYFFTKKTLHRRESRWIETFVNFGIFPVFLKPIKIQIIGESIPRASHIAEEENISLMNFNSMDVPKIYVNIILGNYEEGPFFGTILKEII